ncbi:hypothetical protein [Streptomyces chartreusis]|uniref:hypothetical protein n=1 Tax=Streptomyces chartreusis TaxID=1969 RepID=UPI002E16CD3B
MTKHPSTRCRTCGLHHGPVRHPDGTPPPPFGCRWCGIHPAEHRKRRTAAAGLHTWQRPTNAQILARMHARRVARVEARHLAAALVAFSRGAGLVGPAERRRRERAAARLSCTTCEHFLAAMAPEEPCNPDGCGCTGYPPACDISAAPAGTSLPLVGCTRWEAARPAAEQQPAAAPRPVRVVCDEMNHDSVGREVFCQIEDPDHDEDHDAGDGITWPRED